jgi:hypothetical protein
MVYFDFISHVQNPSTQGFPRHGQRIAKKVKSEKYT